MPSVTVPEPHPTPRRTPSASSSYFLQKSETYGSRPTIQTPVRRMSKSMIHSPITPTAASATVHKQATTTGKSTALVENFIQSFKELESYKNGKPIVVDGHSLSIAGVTAAARYNAPVVLDESPVTNVRLEKSRKVIVDKMANGISVYGVSTGFGGSADTRTDDPLKLGDALLQMQHFGVLPSSTKKLDALPLLDPMGTAMPESWVRGAMLVRMNSLIRGHSGVRRELIEKMNELLRENITPVVPLRGSISASGDLSPLSYIAGTLIGNRTIRVFDGPAAFGTRQIVSSNQALDAHGITPLPLAAKEHLGILNGTAFSASVAALVLNDAIHMALLAQVCTAMGTEALAGTRLSFDPFINSVARPHPGQIETAKNLWDLLEGSKFAETEEHETSIKDDVGILRQDRYSLRTSPQFIGPQVEDILHAVETITIECNSTTDNPLIDGETGRVHQGGNFQAMAVTNAMEKTRLSLHHVGKILFAQCTELMNPDQNRGLPPSLAATDPSLDYHCKGIDIGTAAYVAELGYLATPVSTHIQSAEMHNQAVNSMALVSGRATINSLEVLSILIASYLYSLCQALDLRALQCEFMEGMVKIVSEEFDAVFPLSQRESAVLKIQLFKTFKESFESTSTMDSAERMVKIAAVSTPTIVDYFTRPEAEHDPEAASAGVLAIPRFRSKVAERLDSLLDNLRREYLSGERGPAPASRFLNKTRPVYEFVRLTLGIRMHGSENYHRFADGLGHEVTTGQNVSLIHEAIRDGKMQAVVVKVFSS